MRVMERNVDLIMRAQVGTKLSGMPIDDVLISRIRSRDYLQQAEKL